MKKIGNFSPIQGHFFEKNETHVASIFLINITCISRKTLRLLRILGAVRVEELIWLITEFKYLFVEGYPQILDGLKYVDPRFVGMTTEKWLTIDVRISFRHFIGFGKLICKYKFLVTDLLKGPTYKIDIKFSRN